MDRHTQDMQTLTHTCADIHTDNSTDNAVIQHIQQWMDLSALAEESPQTGKFPVILPQDGFN